LKAVPLRPFSSDRNEGHVDEDAPTTGRHAVVILTGIIAAVLLSLIPVVIAGSSLFGPIAGSLIVHNAPELDLADARPAVGLAQRQGARQPLPGDCLRDGRELTFDARADCDANPTQRDKPLQAAH
jgi:hypothetical protein